MIEFLEVFGYGFTMAKVEDFITAKYKIRFEKFANHILEEYFNIDDDEFMYTEQTMRDYMRKYYHCK